MHPVLFTLPGGFQVYTYGLVIVLSFFLGLELTIRRARKEGIDGDRIFTAGVMTFLAAIITAKIFYLLFEPGGLGSLRDLKSFTKVGLVWYGGLIGGVATFAATTKLYGLPTMRLLDTAAPYTALGYGLHRLFGCFSAGCCYGKPTDVPWGIAFPPGSPAARHFGSGVTVHPTQLYLAGVGFVIFAVLLWFRSRKRKDGEVAWLLLVLYAIARPLVERFRAGGHREEALSWVTAPPQVISWIILAVCLLLLLRSGRFRRSSPGD